MNTKLSAKLVAVTQPMITVNLPNAEALVAYCMAPHHKVLTKNLKWTPCGSISLGEEILGFDEEGPHRKYKTAKVLSHKIEKQDVYEVVLRNMTFYVTGEHKWLISKVKSDGTPWKSFWKTTKELLLGDKIMQLFDSKNYQKDPTKLAYISGIFDGEGFVNKSLKKVSFCQKDNIVLDKSVEYLKSLDYSFNIYFKKDKTCNVDLLGNLKDRVKFLEEVRPERLIQKINFDTWGSLYNRDSLDEILSVTFVGLQDVVVMETSTKTLILDGYPHHNCARVSNPSNQNNEEYSRLLSYCIEHKHWSVFQMVNAVVEIMAPRDISRQFTRHGSLFTIEGDEVKEEIGFDTSQGGIQEFSQRYSDALEYSRRNFRRQDDKNRQNSVDDLPQEIQFKYDYVASYLTGYADEAYKDAIDSGVAKECARVFLPEGLTMSKLYVNGTLRSWLTYLDVREGNGTQLEHTVLANMIHECLKPAFPIVFKTWENRQ